MAKVYGPYQFSKTDRENVDKMNRTLQEIVGGEGWIKCPCCTRDFLAQFANRPDWLGPENLPVICMECGLLLCHPCYDAHCPCKGKPKMHILPCTMLDKSRG